MKKFEKAERSETSFGRPGSQNIFFADEGRLWLYRRRVNSAMGRQRMTVFYSGRVQGVGFRYTVKSITPGFEITGTVRNLDDGRVELIAEGEREELDAFRQAVRESGLGGLIQREEEVLGPAAGGFRGFEIVR